MNDFENNKMLDDMFATAKATTPPASADLMGRILQDAAHVQVKATLDVQASPGFWLRDIVAALGGWPAMGGFVAATSVGVWLGMTPLTGLSDSAAGYLFGGDALSGLDADYDWIYTLDDA